MTGFPWLTLAGLFLTSLSAGMSWVMGDYPIAFALSGVTGLWILWFNEDFNLWWGNRP